MGHCVPEETGEYPEDDKTLTKDEEGDDSDLAIETVVAHAVDQDMAEGVAKTANGNLVSSALADGFDEDDIELEDGPEEVDPTAFLRAPGKREPQKRIWYSSKHFLCH